MGRRQLPKKVLRERRQAVRHVWALIDEARGADQQNIGDSRENLVRDALEMLRTGAAIASFRMTSHGDEDDLRGIDAFVYDFDGVAVPLQVKGSWTGVREHRERHPDIPFVLVDRDQHPREVAIRISCALKIPLPASWSRK